MDNSTEIEKVIQVKNQYQETEILRQIAHLFVHEKLINPEEYLRFLALLKEEF